MSNKNNKYIKCIKNILAYVNNKKFNNIDVINNKDFYIKCKNNNNEYIYIYIYEKFQKCNYVSIMNNLPKNFFRIILIAKEFSVETLKNLNIDITNDINIIYFKVEELQYNLLNNKHMNKIKVLNKEEINNLILNKKYSLKHLPYCDINDPLVKINFLKINDVIEIERKCEIDDIKCKLPYYYYRLIVNLETV